MPPSRPDTWLRDLRVLQLDEHLATSHAGYILAEMGATVEVAARTPDQFEGSRELYALYNGRKPAAHPGDGGFDFVIAGPLSGTAAAAWSGRLPVAEAVFDHAGRGLAVMPELIAQALAGWLTTNRPHASGNVPMRAGSSLILLQAGVTVAMLGLAAWRAWKAGAQAAHYRVSIVQIGTTLLNSIAKVSFTGVEMGTGGVLETQPSLEVKCADGPLHVSAVEEGQFRALCELMGRPELAGDPAFATPQARIQHWEALHVLIRDALEPRSREQVAEECARASVPTVVSQRPGDLFALEQFRARDAWQVATPGGAERLVPRLPWTVARGTVGEGTRAAPATDAPLAGLLIAETSWVWAGPLASELLAFLGARVIKIESDQHTDLFRRSPGYRAAVPNLNTSPSFNQLNLCKESAVLDLTRDDDRALLRALVEKSDAFVSNFRTGVLERMGLTGDVLRAVPGLVAARISGYGPEAPWGERVLYGQGAVYAGGLAAITGSPGMLPIGVGFAFGDCASGNYTALAIVAALCHRDATGEGALIDVSIVEVIASHIVDALLEHQRTGDVVRHGNGHPFSAPEGVYRCGGGDLEWLALAVTNDSEWRQLGPLLGLPREWSAWTEAQRRARRDEIDTAIRAWAERQPGARTAAALLSNGGVPAAAARTPGDNLREPELRESGYITAIDHPDLGRKELHGPPWTVDGRRTAVTRAPLLGEQTAAVRAFASTTGKAR